MLLNFFFYLSFLSPTSIPIFFLISIYFFHPHISSLFFSSQFLSLSLTHDYLFIFLFFSHLSFPFSLTHLYLPFSLSLSLSLSYPHLSQNSNLSTNYKFYLSKLLLFLTDTNSKLISFSNISLSFIISL